MLTPGKDFTVEYEYGIIRCIPTTDEVRSAFKVLQMRLEKLSKELPGGFNVAINVDGVIGPSATLAAQMIALRLAEGSHQELMPFAVAQPEESIPMCADAAMELSGYFDQVMMGDPHAIDAPVSPTEPTIDLMKIVKGYFTKRRMIAAGTTLCGLGGLALIASASQKRALGLIDRSHMLPPSDGSDDMGDDGESEQSLVHDEHAA